MVFVLKFDILFVDGPDSLFELLDFEGHAGEFGFGLVELQFEGGVFGEDLVVDFLVLEQLLVIALEFNVVGLVGLQTRLERFVFLCCLLHLLLFLLCQCPELTQLAFEVLVEFAEFQLFETGFFE